jgi:alpha-mannosidase
MTKKQNIQILQLLPTALFPKQDGPLMQIANLMVKCLVATAQATITIKLGSKTLPPLESMLHLGDNKIKVLLPDIATPEPIIISITTAHPETVAAEWHGSWEPQRKWKIYIVKASHYDLGYDGRIDVMQHEAANYLDLAKRLCADHAQAHEWHYHIEHMRFMRAYEAERTEIELAELVDQYLKKGMMTLSGNPGGPHFHWMDYEQLARAAYPARREMVDRFGLDVKSISVVDNPSASWPAYQMLAQAGFKYLLRFGQTSFRAPGSYKKLGMPKICWMLGPNGKDRILCSFHDHYAESLWLGYGGGYGASVIAEAAPLLADYLRHVENGELFGPYPYDALIVPNYSDWEVPHEDERVLSQWKSQFHYPEVHLDDASQALAHIEKEYPDLIPVISGDTNNNSADYCSIDPRSQGIKRKSTRLLAFAEGLNALAASVSGCYQYPGKAFRESYIDLVEYDEHCWPTMLPANDMNIFNTYVAKVHSISRVAKVTETLLDEAMRTLTGGSIANTGDRSFGITVWNSLAHKRTDLVRTEMPIPVSTGKHRLIDERDGREVPFQVLENGLVVFIGMDIPAYGFRRFRFVDDASPEVRATEKHGRFVVVDDEQLLALENNHYRIAFDKQRGRIVGLYSKSLGKELCDTNATYGLNDWLRCNAPEFTYTKVSRDLAISRIGHSTARLLEKGAVLAGLEVTTVDESLGVKITTKYLLYDKLDHLDIVNDVASADFLHTPASRRYVENIFVGFPFQIPNAEFRVEYGPGTINPATDFAPSSNTDFIIANRWVDVANKDYGITLVPHEAPAIHCGQINYNQFGDKFKASTSHLYNYVWSNRMAGLIALCPEDLGATLSYSIRAHSGDWRQGDATSFGWRQASPLIAFPVNEVRQSQKGIFPERGFISVDDPNIQLSVLKRAEQPGQGYIIRLVEVGGIDHDSIAVELLAEKIDRAYLCDLVENDRNELPVHSNKINLPISKYDVVTIRLQMDAPNLPEIADLRAKAIGDSSVALTWMVVSAIQQKKSVLVAQPVGYNVYRSEDPQAAPTLHTLVGYVENTKYTDEGLQPGKTYYYRVASASRHNHQGTLSSVVAVQTTLDNRTPPIPIKDMGVVPLDHDRLGLFWRRSREADVALYQIHRSRTPGFEANAGTLVSTMLPNRYEYSIYFDSNLQPGESWFYKVLPVDYAGNVQSVSECVSGRTPTMKRFSSDRYGS